MFLRYRSSMQAQPRPLTFSGSQPITRVLAVGMAHRNTALAKTMEAAAQSEIPIHKRRLGVLNAIVTLAAIRYTPSFLVMK
jgi:ADP-ribosylglycohydrolase